FSAGAEVLGADVQDAVRIDVEGDFNLRHAARRWRNSIEMENAQLLVVARQRSLALEHFDFHTRLIIAVSRKDLRLASRNRRIAWNHRSSDSAGCLDRKRQRRYVEQEHVFDFALEHAALYTCANRHHFI